MTEILTIVNFRHAASRIWKYIKPEFRLCSIKLYSNSNHCTTPPHICEEMEQNNSFFWKFNSWFLFLKFLFQFFSIFLNRSQFWTSVKCTVQINSHNTAQSIIGPVWRNDWVLVYELSDCGFESRCSHLNFRYRACFEHEVAWHSHSNLVCGFFLKRVRDMITYSQMHRAGKHSQHSAII